MLNQRLDLGWEYPIIGWRKEKRKWAIGSEKLNEQGNIEKYMRVLANKSAEFE